MNWSNRENTKNKQQAIEALADLLSGEDAIYGNADLDEVEEFANKWNVPFSKQLFTKMLDHIESKRYDYDHPYWSSSNC
jgi:hypothetical protein